MNFFLILLIAISLSMDAFSMSLAYGTLDISKKDILRLSILVGIYHFFMPLLGSYLGSNLLKLFPINSNFIVFIILTIIGLEMIIDTLRKKENVTKMQFLQMIIFGFTVSIDSFSVGIGLDTLTNNYLLSSLIFSMTSFSFTLSGLYIGKKINQIFGRISTMIGGAILIIIALMYAL